ncbi:MAG: cyclic 2,3-diphosphoglycerate synthase [Chloroflexi bacterium]|nr:cyclic 2,3-diphosphoglycerate synthase [Chloroflexota bacterium]MDA1146268.1 cyclic 2,3-diphosphoglycerate synthase [Chloroflexota bacterium]
MPDGAKRRVLILGAAGRDFHNFNVAFRRDAATEVVAFTATQIPGIEQRRYPASLAGEFHPEGIPIVPESELEAVCAAEQVDEVVFAYSDVRHETVMHLASRALATGADFRLLGPERTMIDAAVPVIAVCAARTGAGKSQISRWLGRRLRERGLRVAVLRHPMPYGDLAKQAVQRFSSREDLDAADCTIEEREEYEPHIAAGNLVYAGVDYEAITRQAEAEADVLIWDGGNNDLSFLRPNLAIALTDALRPGDADRYHPGEAVLRSADVVVVNKVNAATADQVEEAEREARRLNPNAPIVRAASPVTLDDEDAVRGRRVLVVDDGPTLTHGGMAYGVGYVAAVEAGAGQIVDPRPTAHPAIAEALARFPHIGAVLPALGYGDEQLAALAETINATPCDVVVSGTPIDLAALISIRVPVVRARYGFAEAGEPMLASIVDAFVERSGLGAS